MAGVGNTPAILRLRRGLRHGTSVNSMILTIGMSVGPVAASMIMGSVASGGSSYANCWIMAPGWLTVASPFHQGPSDIRNHWCRTASAVA